MAGDWANVALNGSYEHPWTGPIQPNIVLKHPPLGKQSGLRFFRESISFVDFVAVPDLDFIDEDQEVLSTEELDVDLELSATLRCSPCSICTACALLCFILFS